MPGSEATDRADLPDLAGELSSLEGVLERLLEAYGELRRRVERVEDDRRRLADALEGADLEELDAEGAAERFQELAEENRRLREMVEEGREHARRIRSRLIMMEDEL
jgi:predicted RNase H-like nuclease (RuvC/YqgF family)